MIAEYSGYKLRDTSTFVEKIEKVPESVKELGDRRSREIERSKRVPESKNRIKTPAILSKPKDFSSRKRG